MIILKHWYCSYVRAALLALLRFRFVVMNFLFKQSDLVGIGHRRFVIVIMIMIWLLFNEHVSTYIRDRYVVGVS